MYRMTLNDLTDFERSPKPNGTPIFCPQQIGMYYKIIFLPWNTPKGHVCGVWGLGLFRSIIECKGRSYDTSFKTSLYLNGKMGFQLYSSISRVTQNIKILWPHRLLYCIHTIHRSNVKCFFKATYSIRYKKYRVWAHSSLLCYFEKSFKVEKLPQALDALP